jgi:hypothetical protein
VWDLLGLTDAHNAKHGNVFAATYGRTDPAYDYSRPFDVFVSNALRDVTLMTRQWSNDPVQFDRYVLLAPSVWAARGLYVVARRDSAIERRLAAICQCHGSALTPSLRTRLMQEDTARVELGR